MKLFDKIVLIDDDPVFLFIAKEIIEQSSLFQENLLTYFNGVRALRDFKETDLKHYKMLVFVDINMPIMDGWDFLDELSDCQLNKDTLVYVVSSSINSSDKEKALSYSIVKGYIPKPLDEAELIKIAQELIV